MIQSAEKPVSDSVSSGNSAAVAAAIRGDADAVRLVWSTHRRWVAAVLLAHKPREADVEDLLQEVAVAFVKTIGELRDGAALKPWLRTVAINAARAAGRKSRLRKREVEVVREAGDEASNPAISAPAEAASGHEEASRLMELARRLPEGYREPLLLRCVRGMSYQQIGALMALPETTIETRIARGRRMLRELADLGPGEPAAPTRQNRAVPAREDRNALPGGGPFALAGVGA